MLYPTLKLVISMQDELLLRDITDPTKLNSVLLRAINTARRGLEQAADLLWRQYADLDNPESHWNNPWTSHDLPGICTHGPTPPRMESLYETGLPLMQADAVAGVLDPNQRTYCVHLRSCREICSHEQVHEMAHGPQPGPTTYIDHVHPVPGDTPQRTQDLWLRRLSQDGRTVIVDHSGSTVWDTISLLNNAANENARAPAAGKRPRAPRPLPTVEGEGLQQPAGTGLRHAPRPPGGPATTATPAPQPAQA